MKRLRALLTLLGLGGMLFLQLSCSSPLGRAQEKAEAVLENLPVMDGATVVCVDKFDRLAKQGIGTHTGIIAVYGIRQDYQYVVNFYRESVTANGWIKFGRTTWDHPWYCNPEHDNVRLELRQVNGTEISCMSEEGKSDYPTFYALDIRVFPFDDIGGCEGEE